MDEFGRYHIPAFGSWNNSDDLQFNDYFEPAKKMDLFNYSNYYGCDRDLYYAGELYGYDVVTPAVIVVPRRRTKSRHPHVKETKKWEAKEQPNSPVSTLSPLSSPPLKKTCKPVDEDLYKISPELLHVKPKKNRGWGIFSSCLTSCVA